MGRKRTSKELMHGKPVVLVVRLTDEAAVSWLHGVRKDTGLSPTRLIELALLAFRNSGFIDEFQKKIEGLGSKEVKRGGRGQ